MEVPVEDAAKPPTAASAMVSQPKVALQVGEKSGNVAFHALHGLLAPKKDAGKASRTSPTLAEALAML